MQFLVAAFQYYFEFFDIITVVGYYRTSWYRCGNQLCFLIIIYFKLPIRIRWNINTNKPEFNLNSIIQNYGSRPIVTLLCYYNIIVQYYSFWRLFPTIISISVLAACFVVVVVVIPLPPLYLCLIIHCLLLLLAYALVGWLSFCARLGLIGYRPIFVSIGTDCWFVDLIWPSSSPTDIIMFRYCYCYYCCIVANKCAEGWLYCC